MKVIYVAGPFRGKNHWEVEQNIRRAETLALEVWRLGVACICPHTNTRFFDGAADDKLWLTGDIEIMKRCEGRRERDQTQSQAQPRERTSIDRRAHF